MTGDASAAVRRVVDALGAPDALEALSAVAGADLTSFLLELMRRRADHVTPASLVRGVVTDRLVEPGTVDARDLHRVIAAVLVAIPPAFEVLELAPVVPLGTHSSVATVHQHKVVTTLRGREVAADPTNMLAVLAAARRRHRVPTASTRLAAVQRVLRAQPMGDTGQAHFSLLGLVTAGRDRGHLSFERAALIEQLQALTAAIATVTRRPIAVSITTLDPAVPEALVDEVRGALGAITVRSDPARTSGRGYYRDVCFKVHVGEGSAAVEVGDGGCTDWIQALTSNRKDRLLISGLGLDRLTALAAEE